MRYKLLVGRIWIIILLILSHVTFAQDKLKILNPVLGQVADLSDSTQKNYEMREKLEKSVEFQSKKGKDEYLKWASKTTESKTDAFDIHGAACSWYCGGNSYKQLASSQLKPSGELTYSPGNAHDLSYKTAWVEGASGDGIGEYLEYYFKNDCPRVTTIIVSNGYVKSDKAWNENSRVKALKLYLNNKAYCILNLQDTKADQVFELGEPVGRNTDGSDLVLKFEILAIYKGNKYSDTAITEIYFDGIDVH